MAQGRAFLTQLRAELDLGTTLDATEPQWASGELAGTPVPSHKPREPGGTGGNGAAGCPSTGQLCAWPVPAGVLHLSRWQGGRNGNWCPRSCSGWRRERRKRQMWAEVSSHRYHGVQGITVGTVTSSALHPCLRAVPFQWDSLCHIPLLCPCSPGVPRARVLLPVVGSSTVPPRLIPDVPSMSLLPVPGVQPALASMRRQRGWAPCGTCTPGYCACPRHSWP